MSIVLDGTAGITFPSGSGTQAAQSKVLQVVQTLGTAQLSTTSTSYVNSTLSASITPLFSTSKILATFSGNCFCGAASGAYYALYRNGSNVLVSSPNALLRIQITGGGDVTQTLSYLDSPSTTSSTTYAIYFYTTNASNAAYININGSGGASYTLTLMEIAA